MSNELTRTSSVTEAKAVTFSGTEDILALFGDAVGDVAHRQEAKPPFTHLTRRLVCAFHLSKPSDSLSEIRELLGVELLASLGMRRLIESNEQLDDETFADVMSLIDAHASFCHLGINSQPTHMALRRLCAQSRGTIDGAFHAQICRLFPPLLVSSYEDFPTVFGSVKPNDITGLSSRIKEDGLATASFVVPDSTIEDINRELDSLPVVDRHGLEYASLSEVSTGDGRVVCRTRDVRKISAAMQLATDPVLIALAESYLGCQPVLENLSAMVSWPNAETDLDSLALNAQLFHYDKDRLRFLKVFVFLSDIDAENGPHAYVRKSHTTRPDALWQQRRFTDEELISEVEATHITEVCGPAGTILMADTMGLHKGVPVKSGTRRVLQIQYSNSFFGAPSDPEDRIEPADIPDNDHLRNYPRLSMAGHFGDRP